MIVLKHLAQEHNIDPYKLRQVLRKKWGSKETGKYKTWRWEDENDPELKTIRKWLSSSEGISELAKHRRIMHSHSSTTSEVASSESPRTQRQSKTSNGVGYIHPASSSKGLH